MQQHIPLEEIIRQVRILRRSHRVNCIKSANGDITIYIMKHSKSSTVGSIELLYNSVTESYTVDWAKVDKSLITKGKLLYYMGMAEAWPCYIKPGVRQNEHTARIWKAFKSIKGLQSKTIDGIEAFRLEDSKPFNT